MTGTAPAHVGGWPWSGPNALASVRELRPGENTLVLFLEPVSLIVAMPAFPGGELALTRFCKRLAHVARQLATASNLEAGQTCAIDGES